MPKANSVKERAALVAKLLQYDIRHATPNEHAGWWRGLRELLHSIREDTYEGGKDHRWGDESWEETFLRYVRTRRISRDQVEEFYCRAVLAGLHNLLEKPDA